ncbi:MAG: hypothetical protein AAB855_01750, partial [Patescibacteria group bacterium]
EVVADQFSMLGVANAIAEETVSSRGAAPARSEGGAAREQREEAPVGVEAASIPEVQYQSEVKVEDLPF